MEIIPAIDVIDNKCVRLTQGDYGRKTIYNEDPLEVAKMFQDWGIRRLHLVDLDGAKARHIVNYKTLERVAAHTSLVIDFGGGLKSDEDIDIAFNSGAAMVTGGSIAVNDPETFLHWLKKYGAEKIILGADHRKGKISTTGWTKTSEFPLMDFISDYRKKGIRKIICTDIARDGMLKGPSTNIYKKILEKFEDISLIASGGVGVKGHLIDLENAGIQSVIIGKAIYEGRISAEEIKEFLDK